MHLLHDLYLRAGVTSLGLAFYPVEYVYRYVRGLRTDLWYVSGEERYSHLPLSMLVGGPIQMRTYLKRLIFGGSCRERHLGRVWSRNVRTWAEKAGVSYSMTAIHTEKPEFRAKAANGCFIIPTWVTGEIPLPLQPEVLHSRSVKSDLKKLRENRLEFEITREPARFEKFYREMHVPYIKEIRGAAAYIEPYNRLKRSFRNCELLVASKDGEEISGAIIVRKDTTSRLWLLGVSNGDRKLLKSGAVVALYYLAIDYLTRCGCTMADVGWSRPFLKDGPLRYKQKLGMRITKSSGKAIALKVDSFDPATRSFLRNNPFLVETEAGLRGTVFLDQGPVLTEDHAKALNKDYLHPGIEEISVYRTPNDTALGGQPTPVSFCHEVEVHSEPG